MTNFEDEVTTETRTLKISYDNIVDAVASFLIAVGALKDDVDIIDVDMGLPVDDDGMVEVDIEVVV